MKAIWKKVFAVLLLVTVLAVVTVPAYAAASQPAPAAVEEIAGAADRSTSDKAYAAACAVGIVAAAGAVAMGIAIAKSVDGISRQPEASEKIRTSLMLGLVFVETAVIYALIVAILIIFVL